MIRITHKLRILGIRNFRFVHQKRLDSNQVRGSLSRWSTIKSHLERTTLDGNHGCLDCRGWCFYGRSVDHLLLWLMPQHEVSSNSGSREEQDNYPANHENDRTIGSVWLNKNRRLTDGANV